MRRGSISVFLALLLVFVLTLSLALLESARISGLKLTVKEAGDSAIDSMFAGYDRTLFEDYGLLFYDGSMGEGLVSYEDVEQEFSDYFEENTHGGILLSGGTFYPVAAAEAKVTELITATDYSGEIFVRSVLDFYRYDGAAALLESLKGEAETVEQGEEIGKQAESGKVPEASELFPDEAETEKSAETEKLSLNEAEAETEKDPVRLVYIPAFGEFPETLNEKAVIRSEEPGAASDDDREEDSMPEEGEEPGAAEENAEEGDASAEESGLSPAEKRKRYESAIALSPIGGAETVKTKGWMNLVIPEGRAVSGRSTGKLNFPSVDGVDDRIMDSENNLPTAVEKVIFNEYLLSYFPNFTDGDETGLQYELEYILYGKESDKENLKTALNRLMWVREGLNLAYILSSSDKMNEAESMASLLVGWTEIEALVPVVQTALIGAWSYAESLLDVRRLLSGGKVPLVKDNDSWQLTLAGAAEFLAGGMETHVSDDEKGLSYRDYLRIFLFLKNEEELSYRAMDMIQVNRQETVPAFLMMSEIYGMEIRTKVTARPVFLQMGIVKRTTGKRWENYEWEVYFSQTY